MLRRPLPDLLLEVSRTLALPLWGLVRLYQVTLSPDHSWQRHRFPGGYCRFAPTCSAYAAAALRRDGLLALPAIGYRLLRCHPWSAGGLDPYHSLTR